MLSLALDCSTSHGSAAVGWRADREPPVIIEEWEFATGRGQGGGMFEALQEVMTCVRDFWEPLGEIVVGTGPGSYSGVRQAIAAATGLAAAVGAALHGVPSALALAPGAERVRRTKGEFAWWATAFHAVGDARRGTFYYTAVQNGYTAVQNGACLAGPELLADAAELSSRLALHPDWPVCVAESPLPGGILPGALVGLPQATALLFADPAARQPPPLEPIYLRPVNITLPKAVQSGVP